MSPTYDLTLLIAENLSPLIRSNREVRGSAFTVSVSPTYQEVYQSYVESLSECNHPTARRKKVNADGDKGHIYSRLSHRWVTLTLVTILGFSLVFRMARLVPSMPPIKPPIAYIAVCVA